MARVYSSFQEYGQGWQPQQPAAQWTPRGTYGLLAAIGAIFVLEHAVFFALGENAFAALFLIAPDWYIRPWSLVTSTLAHAPFSLLHILFNGIMLYFFGPLAERLLGLRNYVALFLAAGALSGVLQVTITGGAALGASGAIMMVFGTLMIVMPKQQILIWGILPVPFWAMGLLYAAMDLLGALGPSDGIGHVAHLSGMAIGIAVGFRLRDKYKGRLT